MNRLAPSLLALLAACQGEPQLAEPRQERPAPAPSPVGTPSDVPPPPHLAPDDPPRPEPTPLAAALTRAEWRKAENRAACAPIAFTSDAGAPGKARRAQFGGGWGVAFDTPTQRSAYGVAGAGLLDPQDDPAGQRDRLSRQWPYFVELDALPQPAFAGYGVAGAQPYPAGNPDGRALHSLAYLRIGGQRCTYNVWSHLGRAHLEALLDSLRIL